jgi:hypothetical protein
MIFSSLLRRTLCVGALLLGFSAARSVVNVEPIMLTSGQLAMGNNSTLAISSPNTVAVKISGVSPNRIFTIDSGANVAVTRLFLLLSPSGSRSVTFTHVNIQ